VVTAETAPLAVFGEEASSEVGAQLEAANVRVLLGFEGEVTPDGRAGGEARPFDRVVAVPRLVGTAPPGVPHDGQGFIPIDTHGVVTGLQHVYAAGDGTDFPVKQGGLAAQQADAVAEVIARRAGAGVEPRSFPGVLRNQLLTGAGSRFLRTDLSSRASTHSQASEIPLWWPAAKIAGLHLAPYLAAKEAALSPSSPEVKEQLRRVAYVPGDFENNPWGE
jgi:sulfide:quinone oxidoreductase